jgi:Zn-dependent peptidase ImmA (M78 family)
MNPKRVKQFTVMHRIYNVEYVKEIKEDKQDFNGMIYHDEQKVLIRKRKNKNEEFDTLIHEMLHAVLTMLHEDNREKFVHSTASVLAQALLTIK